MRVFASVLLVLSSAFAYQVTYPGDSGGWTTSGTDVLSWERVDTDPLNFTAVLTNQNIGYSQILDSLVDGTANSIDCTAPSGGWPTGSGFRVNFAQDPQHLDSLLAQSNQFNITGSSSQSSTSPGSTESSTGSATPTTTHTASSVSSSDTSTTPTSPSAASPGVDARTGLLTAVALAALVITLS